MNKSAALFEKHKFVRRTTLLWSCILITFVVERVTRPDVITHLDGPAATIVTAVIGILSTAIGFYQWSRNKEDNKQ